MTNSRFALVIVESCERPVLAHGRICRILKGISAPCEEGRFFACLPGKELRDLADWPVKVKKSIMCINSGMLYNIDRSD